MVKTTVLVKRSLVIVLILSCMLLFSGGAVYAAPNPPSGPTVSLLVSGMQSGSGSTIGPDGALYVTEGATGNVFRVDPLTGQISTYASGLPAWLPSLGIGGAMDIAFIDQTAYVLVTLVGSDWGGSDVVGIYRVDSPHSFTVIADIGQWSIDNPPPPTTSYDTATGVQYAMQPYRGGFLVNDAHHNRLLKVGLDGRITQLFQFGDIVNTGLALRGKTIYISEAGPIPHLPQNGKIVSFVEGSTEVTQVAAGAPLLVDVEFGLGRSLYGLAQGYWNGPYEGTPADPNTGSLVKVNDDGTFSEIVTGLNQPTSLEFIGNTAYVVTLTGEIWKIDNVSAPPYGR
jgi:sugar lactone lactonase YvrE